MMSTVRTSGKIVDIFDKERNPLRELNTIVKVLDNSPTNIWTEFEEFVITSTLLEHLHQLFTDFSASVTFDTPKMPFWLEGFYGSGKSHFSKVLGHLFQNSQITDHHGKVWNAIDFFIEHTLNTTTFESKIHEKQRKDLVSGLALYPKQIRARTIFINLAPDSKSETKEKEYLESFTKALQKAFNLFLGLSGIIETAELEKALIKESIFDQFKKKVLEEQGKSWEMIRGTTSAARQVFIKAYSKMKNSDIAFAQEFLKGVDIDSKQKDIPAILKEINEYARNELSIPDKGIVGKILIILDEAGLYFSAKESRIGEMMSAAEWINTPENEAHLNMIFSAQQSIKTYFESVKTTVDYRTAEQRFKHWILDKKNIKTVVVRRWLKKDAGANGKSLEKVLDDKYHAIIDGTVFETWKDPNQEYIRPTKDELFSTYPFLPYQFPLMIQVTQKLISEKMVEEQYGGKTRSILLMTRDVLNNPLQTSAFPHFIEEKLGTFVTLSQLYETITYTLKNKDEDQFRLVESTKVLVEDEPTFTKPEREFKAISFIDVAKTVLLLKFVEEVYVNDENIIRALFPSVDTPKALVSQKVKKLIAKLKKEGYLVYKKREVEDQDGNVKVLDEYQIPSQEERKYIERTHHVAITEKSKQDWLVNFFKDKEGGGIELLAFKDQIYLPSLTGPGGTEIPLENAIKLKVEWYLDPELDEVQGKISNAQNVASICVLTNRTLDKYKDSVKKLHVLVQTTVTRANNANKLLIFVTPNMSKLGSDISQACDVLVKSVEECIRYAETIKQETTTMPGNVQTSFHQRIKDIEKEIVMILRDDFDGGLIFSTEKQDKLAKAPLSDDKEDIAQKSKTSFFNDALVTVVRNAYSKINPYAYLGQAKPSKDDIEFILKWDQKVATKIPTTLKKGSKTATTNIPMFTDTNELAPNQTEQYTHVTLKFKEYLDQQPESTLVPGEVLKKTFDGAPYSWNDQTLPAIVAGILRAGEWDPVKGGVTRNLTDKEILDAFIDLKGNCEKFKAIQFKIAEAVSQEDMNKASVLLRNLFSEHVSQIGREEIDAAIKKVLRELSTLVGENVIDLEKFAFDVSLTDFISSVKADADRAQKSDRIVTRIKAFIEIFEVIESDATKKKSLELAKQYLYRIRELKEKDLLERYFELHDFLSTTFTNWLNTQLAPDVKESLTIEKEKVLGMLSTPEVLSDKGWSDAWSIAKHAWSGYWSSYSMLHGKLSTDIKSAVAAINDAIKRTGTAKKINQKRITSIFTCKEDMVTPADISAAEAMTCTKCKSDYNGLRVFETTIKNELEAILKEITPLVRPTKPPIDGGPEPGPEPEPAGPSSEEQASWEKYKALHAEIEAKHTDFENQKVVHAGNKDVLKKIDEILVGFKKEHPLFKTSHECSDEPAAWDVESQACKVCKIPFMKLVDVASAADNAYNLLLDDLRELQDQMLSRELVVEVSITDDAAAIEGKVGESVGIVATILSALKKINPDTIKKVKLTILMEKVE